MPNFHYKSFKAYFHRDAVAGEDYDPDDVRQDDYEFYTGTGRYSDNPPFLDSTKRLVKSISFEEHNTTVTYEVGRVGVTTLAVHSSGPEDGGLTFEYWIRDEPGVEERRGYLHIFEHHKPRVVELD